jgi:hypothetical protein
MPGDAKHVSHFKVGDRVRLNELGRSRSRNQHRQGHVVGSILRSHTRLRVQWDGLKTPTIVHIAYLERVGD